MIRRVPADQQWVIWTGLLGILAAILVGIGEFTFQFSPMGGYESSGYRYFADITASRLTRGHFLGVLSAPLYVAGYIHVFLMLKDTHRKLGWGVLILGTYAFIIGAVWLGGRINLALVVHAQMAAPVGSTSVLEGLLQSIGRHNEPLIQIVRGVMLLLSALLATAILSGRSRYPRWFVLFTPIVLLVAIFVSYFAARPLGIYLLPPAMNVAHLIFFSGSTLIAWVAPGPVNGSIGSIRP